MDTQDVILLVIGLALGYYVVAHYGGTARMA